MFQVGQALGQVGQALGQVMTMMVKMVIIKVDGQVTMMVVMVIMKVDGQVPVSSPGPELPLAFPCEQQPAQEEVHHHDEELDLFEMMSICCLSFRVLVSYHDFWFVLQVLHDFCFCCFCI